MKQILIALCLVGLLTTSCKPTQLGSKANPIAIYFTPSVDAQVIEENSRTFIKYLEKHTNLSFKAHIPSDYFTVIEALGSKRADICIMNSFGYLLANQKFGAKAKLKVIRRGKDYYRGQIIAHIDSKIETIRDIEGKKFAFTNPASTSGFLFPLKILVDNKVTPKSTTYAKSHSGVVKMIYNKKVDAGATFYSSPSGDGTIRDARVLIKEKHPDVVEQIKIIEITENIPNDPFVFRKNFPENLEKKFVIALKKFLQTKTGKKAFENIYGVTGVVNAEDANYNALRDLIKKVNIDIKKLIN